MGIILTTIFKTIFEFVMGKNRWVFVVLGVLVLLYTNQIKRTEKFKSDAKSKTEILTTVQKKYKDDKGRWVNQTTTWEASAESAKDSYSRLKDSTNKEFSEYDKALAKAYEIADDQDMRIKDLQQMNTSKMRTINDLLTQLEVYIDSNGNYGVNIDTIRTKHLFLAFDYQPEDGLHIHHEYQNTIYTTMYIFPKRKEREGKEPRKRFPNWGSIWGWDNVTLTTSEDTTARIENSISIKFQK